MELISRIVLQILALELPLDDKNFNLDRIVADELQSRYSALTTCAIIIAQSQPNGPADVWQIYALSPDIAYGVDITLCGACQQRSRTAKVIGSLTGDFHYRVTCSSCEGQWNVTPPSNLESHIYGTTAARRRFDVDYAPKFSRVQSRQRGGHNMNKRKGKDDETQSGGKRGAKV